MRIQRLDDGRLEVLEGLREGETYVARGLGRLSSGRRVVVGPSDGGSGREGPAAAPEQAP